jgi:hypothetical protein
MNLHDISAAVETIQKAADAINSGERFSVPSLAVRARKAAAQHPHDVSLVTASNVLTKMANDKLFITRAELNKIYDSIYTPNTKLAEVFSEELNRKELPRPALFERSPNEGVSLDRDYERIADPLLANALSAAFDGSKEARLYSAAAARVAERSCNQQLSNIGIPPKRVGVFAGQGDIIICDAEYETPKGIGHVLVPVELKDKVALFPTMFLSEAGFTDLTKDAVEQHIISTAGGAYHVDGEKMLKILSTAKYGFQKVASTVEMAAIRIQAQKQAPAPHDPNGILYQKIDPVTPDVQLPNVPRTAEEESFAEKLSKPDGVARHIFGERVVENGRSMLVRKMAQLGFNNAQIRVANVSEDTIFYAVGIGVGAMKVPVKVSGNMVEPPSVAIASGQLISLTKSGVEDMLKNKVDTRMLAISSPAHGMRPSELVEQVRVAVNEGNLAKAEDAINVLGEVDQEAQKTAIAILMQSLSGHDPDDEMDKVANREVKDVPYTMTHKVFFPDGV